MPDATHHGYLHHALINPIGPLAFNVQAINTNGFPRSIGERTTFIKGALRSAGIGKLSDLPLGTQVEQGGVICERLV